MKRILSVMMLAIAQLLFATTSYAAIGSPNDELYLKYINKIFDEYTKCDYNLSVVERAYNDLCAFYDNYDESTATQQKNAFYERIEEYYQQLQAPCAIVVDDADAVLMRGEPLSVADVSGFNMDYEMSYEDMRTQLDLYEKYARDCGGSAANLRYDFEPSKLSLECSYYGFLYTLSALPAPVKDSIANRVGGLNYKFDVSLMLPAAEYERLVYVTIERLEERVAAKRTAVNEMELMEEMVERLYESYEQAYNAFGVALEEFEQVSSTTLNRKDSREVAYQKVKSYSDALDKMIATASEYLSLYEELSNYISVDMEELQMEKDVVNQFINEQVAYRNSLISEYNSRGWGNFL